jgi:hypothetical protein
MVSSLTAMPSLVTYFKNIDPIRISNGVNYFNRTTMIIKKAKPKKAYRLLR